jgi:DNA-binding LytR/AlgR family response regulator
MRVLIVEDEPRAANRLARLIKEVEPAVEVLAKIPSIAGTIEWLDQNTSPDLIFMDVRLEDGESFEILSQKPVDSPIVFCTAYSEYALQAFAVNSIDYLLKPVVRRDLSRALTKYKKLSGYRMASSDWPDFPLEDTAADKGPAYRQQFLVALAGRFRPVQAKDLVAAKSYLKGTQLIDRQAEHWLLDDSLAEIERALDPSEFMRISRQWLVRLSAIQSLTRTGRGYVVILPALAEPITVSRARVNDLKDRLSY